MNRHIEFMEAAADFRLALTKKFSWFIHETPLPNLPSICRNGLLPMKDFPPPEDVRTYFGSSSIPILCLHPLGSLLVPRGAANSLDLPMGASEPKRVKLALSSRDLPKRVGLDWSYEWKLQELRFHRTIDDSLDVIGCSIAHEFGSVVSYDPISPSHLRICTSAAESINPDDWPFLSEANESEIALFD